MWRAIAAFPGILISLLTRQAPLFVGALVLSAGVAGAAFGLANYLYDRHVEAASDGLKNLSFVISDHANRSMLAVNQSVSKVVDALQSQKPDSVAALDALADGPELRAKLDEIVVDNPFLDSVFVIDADGRVDQRSRAGLIPADLIVGTDYMKSLKNARPGAFVLSAPFESYQFHTWMMNYSRRVSRADGGFLGAVAGIVKLSSFSDLFDKVNLQSKGSMAMYAASGDLLSWAPQAEIPFGPTLVGTDVYDRYIAPRRDGVTRAVSPYDDTERLLAIASAPDFPVSVMVATGMPDVIAEWSSETSWLTRASGLVILAIWLGAARLALGLERFAERRERRLIDESNAEQEAILNSAIDNIEQGLAMFDRSGALVIYNKRYAEMYGLPEHELIRGVAHEELQSRLRRNGRAKAFERAAKGAEDGVLSYNHLQNGRIIAQRKKGLPDGGWVSTHEDVTDRRAAETRIHELAAYDVLTGLFNRAEFGEQLKKRLADHHNHGVPFALLHIDLDRFKAVNDQCGPHGGDEALRQAAGRLTKAVGSDEGVFRLGGDTFAVIERIENGPRDAAGLAHRVITALGEPFRIRGAELKSSASAGITLVPADGVDAETLMRNAELALDDAKQGGRGRYAFFARAMRDEITARLKLESDLRIAIAGRQFELHYQPIVSLKDQRLAGFEALIRWRHPERGLVPPVDFILCAEEIGLIVEIGDWALREACRKAASWPEGLTIAVNVSPLQIRSPGFSAAVASALSQAGLAGSRLVAEITENVLIKDALQANAVLQEIKKLGVAIALDDFGTGYSSLSYLRKFPFDKIKIDKSFVGGLGADPSAATIARAAIALAEALGIGTVAEGIETEDQMTFLAKAGCVEGQGYLFSKPMSAADADAWVARDYRPKEDARAAAPLGPISLRHVPGAHAPLATASAM